MQKWQRSRDWGTRADLSWDYRADELTPAHHLDAGQQSGTRHRWHMATLHADPVASEDYRDRIKVVRQSQHGNCISAEHRPGPA
jgi:hypothetical protein